MSVALAPAANLAFTVPDELIATAPAEAFGLSRDDVRLMVVDGRRLEHRVFAELVDVLQPGDLVVVNTSATVNAAVDAVRGDGRPVVVHFATALGDGRWVVELRHPHGPGPQRDAAAGERLQLGAGAELLLVSPSGADRGARFWVARADPPCEMRTWLRRHGRPITYQRSGPRWPLAMYQTVFAGEPGSAEMPSAARPFTHQLVLQLMNRGVSVARVVLHCSVSSPETGEPPLAEQYTVPAETARLVNATHRWGGRVVAVGTTVARALETVAQADGSVRSGTGWTNLVLSPANPARVVDALVTGWHEPESSHLQLLEAIAGRSLVERAYQAALDFSYRWHEFGDSCLFVAPRNGSSHSSQRRAA